MKTKGIPAVVMLLAGFVTCIIGIVQHMETDVFIKTLLAVLIIFYLYLYGKFKKTRKSPEKNRHRNSQTRMGRRRVNNLNLGASYENGR